MNYDEWVKTVPDEITGDNLWTMTVYRQALFLGDLAWRDATKLAQDQRTLKLSGQLHDSVASAPRLQKAIAERLTEIRLASTSTRLDRPENRGIGITKADMCWTVKSLCIEFESLCIS